MTAAPTASQILRSLDHHRAQAQFASLADLDAAHSDAVRRALSAVRPTSRIDVPKLLDSVRRDVAERAEAEAAKVVDPMSILKFKLGLASKGQLESLRDELRAERGTVTLQNIFDRLSAIAQRMAAKSPRAPIADAQPIEPDIELDDDEPPRRRVPRVRSKRAEGESPASAGAPDQPPRQPTRQTRSPGRPAQQLSGRVFGLYGDITPREPDFPNPPWLLPDQPDEAERATASA